MFKYGPIDGQRSRFWWVLWASLVLHLVVLAVVSGYQLTVPMLRSAAADLDDTADVQVDERDSSAGNQRFFIRRP
jgi:hypothetical protein